MKNVIGGRLRQNSPSKNADSFSKTQISDFQTYHKGMLLQVVEEDRNTHQQFYKNKSLT